MNLQNIKGDYDAIFSLGHLCLAAIQLRKHDLRPFAGPLDWFATYSLSDVNRLLRNRFTGFMEAKNLRVAGYNTAEKKEGSTIYVIDDNYHVGSVHDFDADKNTLDDLATYPEVIEKFNRRINRFLEKMSTGKRILFVRTEGSFEEAKELELILSEMVQHDFSVLLVRHTNVTGIVENHWPLEKVCAVELPGEEIWEANHDLWTSLFEGIKLV
ncbi:DUF1796 family putative cysteine peptidase [Bacillus sonorensis]|uniref:Peptidase n=2 Tax=Bacillus sonorensis TaxID=119858 RepID=M5P9X1_9BACI|nr:MULTISPECIES: DUF1796 family putative cysteine peptidase [Bacillus]TWK82312.1 hypothetical protein CHCC20335_3355 [Bacillus paralicheniformis]ASB88934.1 hypothetical protein S101395_02427 [Bacillus sonorensis]EME76259.1 hypothetical protein BSONL12_00702 [Bacillus sonorensis L12]MBG9915294.1 peptidase [Bacillus sonorensis]MCY8035845.1 papain-like cysteine peptidase [Bacillus sonorensis]